MIIIIALNLDDFILSLNSSKKKQTIVYASIVSLTLSFMIMMAATTTSVLAISQVQMIAPNDKATATSLSTGSQKCNNVMILVKVKHIPDNITTLVLTANLDGRNVVKAINIKDQNIIDLAAADKGSVTVPLSFKNLTGCKSGDQFAGSVNDVIPFVGKLDNPKKPTKVSVSFLE